MLNILLVNPTGLGSYGVVSDVVLAEQGLVWVHGCNYDRGGVSNGAGKTSLFNAISACLFGRIETFLDGSLAVVGDEFVNETYGRCCARVVWRNSRGQLWRVTLSRKWKGATPYTGDSPLSPFSGTDIYLEQFVEGGWVDRRAAEMRETRARCIEAVGVTYERFLASAYLPQGRGFDFLRGTHAQRMAILADVVNLTIWDNAQVEAKRRREEVEVVLRQKRLVEAGLRGQLQQLHMLPEEQYAALQVHKTKALALVQTIQAQHQAWSAELFVLEQGLSGAVENPYRAEQSCVEERAAKMALEIRVEILRVQAARALLVCEIDQEKVEIESLVGERRQESRRAATLQLVQKDIDRWMALYEQYQCAGSATCPTCGAPFTDIEILQQRIKKATQELEYLQAENLYAELESVRYRVVLSCALWSLELRWSLLGDDLQELTSWLHLLDAQKRQVLSSLEVQAKAWVLERQGEATRAQQTSLQNNLAKALTDLEETNRYLGQVEARLAYEAQARTSVVKINEQLSVVMGEISEADRMATEYAWMARNFGDKGVKAWRVVEVCGRLNALLAEAIGDLDGSFSVLCRPYRPTAKAAKKDPSTWTVDDVVYEIEVLVQEGGKEAVPLRYYSGGEVSILAFAFLIAFWRLSDELGAGTNLLLVDEAVGALDNKSAQIVLRFLEGLRASGKTVLVVSHSELVDLVNWDATWLVSKKKGLSKIDMYPRGMKFIDEHGVTNATDATAKPIVGAGRGGGDSGAASAESAT